MRFCMVTTFYPPYNFGGDGLFVQSLSRALVAQGHEVHVVHCLDAFQLVSGRRCAANSRSDDQGVVVHRLAHKWSKLSPLISHQFGVPGLKSNGLSDILSLEFDVVNFHNTSLIGGPGVFSWSRAPVNFYTFHDHWLLCPTHSFWKNRRKVCDKPSCLSCSLRSGVPPQLWRYSGIVESGLASIDKFLSPSRFTAEAHLKRFPDLPIEVLPTFSDLGVATTAAGRRARSDRFLFAGRLVESKGVRLLLEEFEANGLSIDVAGDGPLEAELRERFSRPNINFLGRLTREALTLAMQNAVAVVVPSLAPEVFPLVCLEALECATPVVCTRAGGCAEAVENTGGGLVYSNAEELRASLQQLLTDSEFARRLGELGREGQQEQYTRARYLHRYLQNACSQLEVKGLSPHLALSERDVVCL